MEIDLLNSLLGASSFVWVPQCEAVIWNPAEKPVMDMFDEIKPNMVISSSEVFSDKATELRDKLLLKK